MAKLEEYQRKRRFDRTPEPSGEPVPAAGKVQEKPAPAAKRTRLPKPKLPQLEVRPGAEHGDTFVVQKHRATRLHYDFRLAINGPLKSWAVPKGPSQSHADKRLAVHVEDHPLDYANFEGKIPEGNYGAGTVMVWDRGTFHLEGSLGALKQLEKGEIKFSLNGEKLRGSFVLVKLKQSEKGNEWLMIKHKDAAEDSSWNIDEHDGSALTGRTIEEIKEELPPKRSPTLIQASELQGARKGAMPSRLEPMLATLADRPFSDPNWLFEIKWDGVRALARIENGALALRSRNSIDITKRYPELASLPDALAARQAILDGEIVALDAQGHSSFERLQERMHVRAPQREPCHANTRRLLRFRSSLLRRLRPSRSASARAQTAPATFALPFRTVSLRRPSVGTRERAVRACRTKRFGRNRREASRQPLRFRSKPILGEAEEYQDSRRGRRRLD